MRNLRNFSATDWRTRFLFYLPFDKISEFFFRVRSSIFFFRRFKIFLDEFFNSPPSSFYDFCGVFSGCWRILRYFSRDKFMKCGFFFPVTNCRNSWYFYPATLRTYFLCSHLIKFALFCGYHLTKFVIYIRDCLSKFANFSVCVKNFDFLPRSLFEFRNCTIETHVRNFGIIFPNGAFDGFYDNSLEIFHENYNFFPQEVVEVAIFWHDRQ